MSRFTHSTEPASGETLHFVRDNSTGGEVVLWPGFGNNCLSLTLPGPDGTLVNAIDDLAFITGMREEPSRYGTPVLFPWCGRIPRGEYLFDGQRYELPTFGAPAAVHGFVKERAWKVEETRATAKEASVRCIISSDEYPETLEGYPFPYRLTITTRLDAGGMTMDIEVVNTGQGPMPFGVGLHPYFSLPPGQGGTRHDCLMTAETTRQWDWTQIANLDLAPDAQHDFSKATHVPAIANPQRLGSANYDDGLTGWRLRGDTVEAALTNPLSGRSIVMQASADFRTLLFFTPSQRDAACLEPWTCTVNAFNLAALGYEESGLLVLPAGSTWHGWMRITIR